MLGLDESDFITNMKRLDSLRLAVMIDEGNIAEAKSKLEELYLENSYNENEKDIQVVNMSLLGILKR